MAATSAASTADPGAGAASLLIPKAKPSANYYPGISTALWVVGNLLAVATCVVVIFVLHRINTGLSQAVLVAISVGVCVLVLCLCCCCQLGPLLCRARMVAGAAGKRSGAPAPGQRMLRIGILGAARIAPPAIISPAHSTPGVEVYAVAARNQERAAAFAKKHNIPHVAASYDELLAMKELDIIFNPLPNGLHHEWTIKALRAGKHVLCEKPIASNEQEAREMAAEAKKAGKVLVEAFHVRYHPALRRAREIVSSGELGATQSIDVKMSIPSFALKDDDIRFNYGLAGGTMMDLGCYASNMLQWFADREEPEVVSATPTCMPGNDKVDVRMQAVYKFPRSGIQGTLDASLRGGMAFYANIVVTGERGTLTFRNFVGPSVWHKIIIKRRAGVTAAAPNDGTPPLLSREEKVYADGVPTYHYQLRAFVAHVRGGPPVETDMREAVQNMRVIDSVYRAAGLPLRGSSSNTSTEGAGAGAGAGAAAGAPN